MFVCWENVNGYKSLLSEPIITRVWRENKFQDIWKKKLVQAKDLNNLPLKSHILVLDLRFDCAALNKKNKVSHIHGDKRWESGLFNSGWSQFSTLRIQHVLNT